MEGLQVLHYGLWLSVSEIENPDDVLQAFLPLTMLDSP